MNWMCGCERKIGVKDDSTYFDSTDWKGRVATEMRGMLWKAFFSPNLFSCAGGELDVSTDVFSKTE